MCAITKDEYVKTAAMQADKQAASHPGASIPVAPEVADYMGAFREDAVSEADLDDALTFEEMELLLKEGE
jgi:hypothetical protein